VKPASSVAQGVAVSPLDPSFPTVFADLQMVGAPLAHTEHSSVSFRLRFLSAQLLLPHFPSSLATTQDCAHKTLIYTVAVVASTCRCILSML